MMWSSATDLFSLSSCANLPHTRLPRLKARRTPGPLSCCPVSWCVLILGAWKLPFNSSQLVLSSGSLGEKIACRQKESKMAISSAWYNEVLSSWFVSGPSASQRLQGCIYPGLK